MKKGTQQGKNNTRNSVEEDRSFKSLIKLLRSKMQSKLENHKHQANEERYTVNTQYQTSKSDVSRIVADISFEFTCNIGDYRCIQTMRYKNPFPVRYKEALEQEFGHFDEYTKDFTEILDKHISHVQDKQESANTISDAVNRIANDKVRVIAKMMLINIGNAIELEPMHKSEILEALHISSKQLDPLDEEICLTKSTAEHSESTQKRRRKRCTNSRPHNSDPNLSSDSDSTEYPRQHHKNPDPPSYSSSKEYYHASSESEYYSALSEPENNQEPKYYIAPSDIESSISDESDYEPQHKLTGNKRCTTRNIGNAKTSYREGGETGYEAGKEYYTDRSSQKLKDGSAYASSDEYMEEDFKRYTPGYQAGGIWIRTSKQGEGGAVYNAIGSVAQFLGNLIQGSSKDSERPSKPKTSMDDSSSSRHNPPHIRY